MAGVPRSDTGAAGERDKKSRSGPLAGLVSLPVAVAQDTSSQRHEGDRVRFPD